MTQRPAGLAPTGFLTFWMKSMTGTPALPSSWAEANGQTITNPQFAHYGQAMPNLNSTSKYIRGSTTSGTTGGADSVWHRHQLTKDTDFCYFYGCSYKTCYFQNTGYKTMSTEPSYVNIVWIVALTPSVIPIGGGLFYLKSLTGVPALPDEYFEYNGQTLSDTQSPSDGVTVADLNGTGGTKCFLRGSTASGHIAGADTNTHQHILDGTGIWVGIYHDWGWGCATANKTVSVLPPYCEVVWVGRKK